MVALLKTYSRCATLIYLAVSLILIGCSEQRSKTIITLHHIDSDNLENLITESLGKDTRFQIVDSRIIIFAQKKEIQSTLELLAKLDRPPQSYLLSFKSKPNHYTTVKATLPITLRESTPTSFTLFNIESHISIVASDTTHSTLHITSQTKDNLAAQQILLKHNMWHSINWGLSSGMLIMLRKETNK